MINAVRALLILTVLGSDPCVVPRPSLQHQQMCVAVLQRDVQPLQLVQ